jgi:hypothetical protein
LRPFENTFPQRGNKHLGEEGNYIKMNHVRKARLLNSGDTSSQKHLLDQHCRAQ